MEEVKNTIKFYSGLTFSGSYSVFFLTDTCKGIIKSSGARKLYPNSKFPDIGSAE